MIHFDRATRAISHTLSASYKYLNTVKFGNDIAVQPGLCLIFYIGAYRHTYAVYFYLYFNPKGAGYRLIFILASVRALPARFW